MNGIRIYRGLAMITAAVLAGTLAVATGAVAEDRGARWTGAWAASPVVGSEIPGSSCPAGKGLRDQTVRNVVFASAGGSSVRVRLTNAFGTRPLRVGHASIAVQATNADPVPATLRSLTFRGRTSTVLPAGAEVFSDPVRLDVKALSTLLVSVYVPEATGPVTNHPFTAQGNYLGEGNLALARDGAAFQSTPCWMLVSGVDVAGARRFTGSVVALGDSITDTANTTGNANHRWPDFLARRLNALPGRTLSVVNAGLGGNRLLAPREGQPYYGVPALDRLDRDVFGQSGVDTVILLEGINDIGYDATAEQIVAACRQIAEDAHARGLRVLGGTITPFKASAVWSEQRGNTWRAVNSWIRTSGVFDGVVDFAAATAAPGDPLTLDPAYDSGDGLHPNDAGTKAMADAVDLAVLLG